MTEKRGAKSPPVTNGAPHDEGVGPVPGSSPRLETPAETIEMSNGLAIDIVFSALDAPCHFWVGLSKPGQATCSEVLDCDDVSEVMQRVAENGIAVQGQVLLSDTSRMPPFFAYLMPPPGNAPADKQMWVQSALKNLRSWSPEFVGFYLAPELIDIETAQELLFDLISRLAEVKPTRRYCLLVGSYGLHRVLNMALFLKAEFERTAIPVRIFH